MKAIHPLALFRLSVLGPLASRERLEHGELKRLLRELAVHTYFTPAEHQVRVSEKTLDAWYYAWKRGGIEALVPKTRRDRGHSKLPPEIQEAIVGAKRDYPKRSLTTLKRLLEMQGGWPKASSRAQASTACSNTTGSPGWPAIKPSPSSGADSWPSTPAICGRET